MSSTELKAYRESLKLSKQQFADLLGVSQQCINFWENGTRPINKTTVKLIKLFQKFPQLIQEF